MSVPALNQSVVNLASDVTHQRGEKTASTKGVTARAVGSPSRGPSFSAPESKSSMVFAGGQGTAGARDQGASQASTAKSTAARGAGAPGQGLFDSVKGFFSPAGPIHHKPDPQHPVAMYDQMARKLLNNFDVYRDPKQPGYITPQSLKNKAERPLTGNPIRDRVTKDARKILEHPPLMKALDRDGRTGALDERFSRQNIQDLLRSKNPMKYYDDKQLAEVLFKGFDKLKGGFWSDNIKIPNMREISKLPLTGNPLIDKYIFATDETLRRSNLTQKMDDLASRDKDEKISKKALWLLSR